MRSAKRCPRCRGRNFDVAETITVLDCFEVRGGLRVSSYATGEACETLRAEATCKDCGHHWRMKHPAAWCI